MLGTRISDEEIRRRRNGLHEIMSSHGVDVVLFQQFGTAFYGGYVRYFTNLVTIGEPLTVLYTSEQKVVAITHRPAPKPEIRNLYPVDEWMGVELSSSANHAADAELVLNYLRRHRFEKIGVVGLSSTSAEFFSYLMKKTSQVVDLTDEVDRLMSVKSEFELELIKKAANIVDEGIKEGIEHVKIGAREHEIVAAIVKKVVEMGSETQLIGIGSAPKGKPAYMTPAYDRWGREIKDGDTVTILVECSGPGGYFTEVSRQVVVGSQHSKITSMFEELREIQSELARNLKDGVKPSELIQIYKEMAGGQATITGYGIGHNQGLRIIERPIILEDEQLAFQKNMNIPLHPSISTSDTYVWMSDNYVITETGAVKIHETPQELFFV